MRRREVKREGTRALCLILFFLISTLTVSTDSSISRIIDSHSDQSDNFDAAFHITSDRVYR